MNNTLFSNENLNDGANDENTSLVWKSSGTDTQNKTQKSFLSTLKKHQDLIEKSKKVDELFMEASVIFNDEIVPEHNKQDELEKEKFEVMLDIYISDKLNLKGRIKESFREMLLDICGENSDNPKHIAFYYQATLKLLTPQEKAERQKEKEFHEKQIKQQYGIDVDMDEINNTDLNNEEEKERIKEKYKEFFEKTQQNFENEFNKEHNDNDSFENAFGFNQRFRERKKTAKQLEKEKKDKEVADLLNKDINKLFKELAKTIHPDRELDPVLRDKKENLMKQLSNARDNMNIGEILYIKMLIDDLVPENSVETAFNDDSIKRFIKIIKDKIKEIEHLNLSKIYQHPLFSETTPSYIKNTILPLDKSMLKPAVNKRIIATQMNTSKMASEVENLKQSPKLVKELIKKYQEEKAYNPMDEGFLDFLGSIKFR